MIRTPDYRVRVFVSSTMGELAAERSAARDAIQKMRLSPIMFELGARAHPPRSLYRAYLDQSDIFVGIYWQNYGWTAPDMAVSGVEDEYLLSGSKPRLLYVKQPAPDREPRLGDLLTRIETENVACYKRFSTPDQLQDLVANDVAVLLTERFVSEHDAGSSSPARFDNLPAVRTDIVGRESEVAAACEALRRDGAGLVTLTGLGGTGKTRIALEVARTLRNELEHGVCMVDLASVRDPGLIASTVAGALGVTEAAGRSISDALTDSLRHRQMLLVLDNFEQVVSGAPTVTALMAACPRLRVLVTSRQALHVRGERELAVPPLPVGGIDSAATRLFLERARDVRAEFGEGAEDAAAVVEICRRLDGLPLAIELAAARARVLSPKAMLARLDKRLALLTGGAQDLPERQRTMRAAIGWSHDLLDPEERALYRRLAVFRGGFGLDAAEAVAAADGVPDVLEGISSLVGKSMLRAGDADGAPRFSMLATVNEHALECLEESGEAPATFERHARHYADVVARGEGQLQTPARTRWLAQLSTEIDNLRATCDWAVAHDPSLALRTTMGLVWFWYFTGVGAEGRKRMGAAVTAAEGKVDALTYARGVCTLGMIAVAANDFACARENLDRARALLVEQDDPLWLGRAACFSGLITHIGGDPRAALGLFDEALTLLRRSGDRWDEAQALIFVGNSRLSLADASGAESAYQQSLSIYESLGERWGRNNVLNGLSDIAAHEGDFARARGLALEAEALARELTDSFALGHALSAHGNAALALGDLADGEAALREALAFWQSNGYMPMIWLTIAGLAAAALTTGRRERARVLWASVRRLLLDSAAAMLGGGPSYLPRYRAALDAAFDPTSPPSTAVSLEEALARASRTD
jgi:predicted ATPase